MVSFISISDMWVARSSKGNVQDVGLGPNIALPPN
jgi:hypothetical protein